MSSPVLLYLTKHHCVGTSQIYYLHCNELYDDDDDKAVIVQYSKLNTLYTILKL